MEVEIEAIVEREERSDVAIDATIEDDPRASVPFEQVRAGSVGARKEMPTDGCQAGGFAEERA